MKKKHSHRVKIGIAPLEYEYKVESESEDNQKPSIKFLSPRDGEAIIPKNNEPLTIRRPVSGEVTGFQRRDTEEFQFVVEIFIKTDKWYEQGTVRIENNGQWKLDNAYFGGKKISSGLF